MTTENTEDTEKSTTKGPSGCKKRDTKNTKKSHNPLTRRRRAYLAVKYHPDQANRDHIEALLQAIEQAGYEGVCVVRDLEVWGRVSFEPRELMRRTFELMDGCELVVVDLAEKGVGVGIEAGYARAHSQTLVAVAPAGKEISPTLQGIANGVCSYADYAALAEFLGGMRKSRGG